MSQLFTGLFESNAHASQSSTNPQDGEASGLFGQAGRGSEQTTDASQSVKSTPTYIFGQQNDEQRGSSFSNPFANPFGKSDNTTPFAFNWTPPGAQSQGGSSPLAARGLERISHGIELSSKEYPGQTIFSTLVNQVQTLSVGTATAENSESKTVAEAYDINQETGPGHELFTSKFRSDLQRGLEIAKKTVAVLEEVQPKDALGVDGHKLLAEARELATFHGSDTRKIAVLGDSGEGKSTLINSLLHFPGIAQTGDIGSACTSVVTEYRQRQSQHAAPITIEVEYLSKAGIEDMVRELLWSYRQLYLPIVESDETSEQDYARYQRESEYAWSALNAAFSHQSGFHKELLRDMSEGASDRITDQLIGWAGQIVWPTNAQDGKWTSAAQTADECCEKTKLFMQDRLWPFTKIIRVYLDSVILKSGIVLADLPGLQDTNLARVRATQDYLMKCDNIFIVAKIQRAITDQSVKSSLYWVLSRHAPMEWEASGGKNLKVAVVCTRSEDINLSKAKAEFSGEGTQISGETVAQLEQEIEAAKKINDRPRKKEAKRMLEFLFIQARNAYVKEGLQRAYSSQVPNGQLDVFCVSNTTYEKYCKKGSLEYVDASGIPELRRFCRSISADAQLKEARHFLHSSLAGCLNSVGLWVGTQNQAAGDSSVSSSSVIPKAMKALEKETESAVKILRNDFMEEFDQQITNMFTNYESKWEDTAVAESRSWESWHWTQYNAWCLRDGKHRTDKRGHADWNANMIWKMRMETELAWELVLDEIHDVFESIRSTILSELKAFKEKVLATPSQTSLTALGSSIDFASSSLEYKLGLEERQFQHGVSSIQRKSTESHANSFILDDMRSSYRAASSQSGTGKAARQRHIVGGHVAERRMFACMAIRLQADMATLAQKTEDKLLLLTQEMMRKLKVDVKLAIEGANRGSQVNMTKHQEAIVKLLDVRIANLQNKLAEVDMAGRQR